MLDTTKKGRHGSVGLIYIYVEYMYTQLARSGGVILGQAGGWGHCIVVIWLGGIHKPTVRGY